MRHHQRYVAVQRHGLVQLVLKHVQVVQPVRLLVVRGGGGGLVVVQLGGGGLQGQAARVLRDAVHVVRQRKGEVQAHRHGSHGLGVLVPAEGLLPVPVPAHTRILTGHCGSLFPRAVSIRCKSIFAVIHHFFASMSISDRHGGVAVCVWSLAMFEVHQLLGVNAHDEEGVLEHVHAKGGKLNGYNRIVTI